MITLLIATRNAHKAAEIRAILGSGFHCLTLKDFPSPPPVVEDAPTFAGNAVKKAVVLTRWLTASNYAARISPPAFVLADDSGLEVDPLDGAPGVRSARFAAPDAAPSGNSPDADNNAKLLHLLRDVPAARRTARFRCALALAPVVVQERCNASPVCSAEEAELRTELFEGVCEGRIGLIPQGQGGFGYDPLFVPAASTQTFAELGEQAKNQFSHRALALAKLKQRLLS